MFLNINPIKSNANCFANNIIIQTCNYYNIDCIPFFLRYFNDSLSLQNLSSNILATDPSVSMAPKYPYEKLVGFTYKYAKPTNYKEMIISQLRNGFPVGICIDGICLPWSITDKSVDRMILIVGYDFDEKFFICADGYLSKEYQKLHEEKVFKASSILLFCKDNSFIFKIDNAIDAILYNYTIETILKRNSEMIEYKKYMQSNLLQSISKIGYSDLMTTPFVYNLSHFVSNRNYFYKAIDELTVTNQGLKCESVKSILHDVVQKWNLYKNLIIKTIISSNQFVLNKSSALLDDIIKKEDEIMMLLLPINLL